MSHCPHQVPYWNPDARCTDCGHRTFTSHGEQPRQTRDLPFRFWIFELAGRIEARLRRRYL